MNKLIVTIKSNPYFPLIIFITILLVSAGACITAFYWYTAPPPVSHRFDNLPVYTPTEPPIVCAKEDKVILQNTDNPNQKIVKQQCNLRSVHEQITYFWVDEEERIALDLSIGHILELSISDGTITKIQDNEFLVSYGFGEGFSCNAGGIEIYYIVNFTTKDIEEERLSIAGAVTSADPNAEAPNCGCLDESSYVTFGKEDSNTEPHRLEFYLRCSTDGMSRNLEVLTRPTSTVSITESNVPLDTKLKDYIYLYDTSQIAESIKTNMFTFSIASTSYTYDISNGTVTVTDL